MALPRPLGLLVSAGTLLAAMIVPAQAYAQTTAAAPLVSDPASLVNPLLGTTNGANDFPGADVPFGMTQWSPDTASRAQGGGYVYTSPTITGFSLTHIAGPGCGAYGDVPIMPTTGAISSPGSASSSYTHANESASPGYYGVTLGNGVKTELTTTTRGGIGRFTFPATTQANLLFKLTGSQNGDYATYWQVVSNTEVVGSVTSGHFCGAGNTYTLHFSVAFDQPFTTGTWLSSAVKAGAKTTSRPSPRRVRRRSRSPRTRPSSPASRSCTAPSRRRPRRSPHRTAGI